MHCCVVCFGDRLLREELERWRLFNPGATSKAISAAVVNNALAVASKDPLSLYVFSLEGERKYYAVSLEDLMSK